MSKLEWLGFIAVLIIFGIVLLRIPFCLYHAFTPRYDAPLICTV